MKEYQVQPGSIVKLKSWNPDQTGTFGKDGKENAQIQRQELVQKLSEWQEKLYAGSEKALLIILQAMDTGGKDSTIKRVMAGINPQGCQVSSFKKPTPLEKSHHFLWRINRKIPPKGYIGIFNRSHYEDVLVPRVHQELSAKDLKRRYGEINDFERALSQGGTRILKFFLHISKTEQRKRLEARLRNPKKHWKFDAGDLRERKHWGAYQKAYEAAFTATSTPEAPWCIIPGNHKWYRDVVVAQIIVSALEEMKLSFPPPPAGVDFDKIRLD